jgi:integrase
LKEEKVPAEARPRARRLPSGRWQLRYTVDGLVQSGGVYDSKTEALNAYRDVIAPSLNGGGRRDLTVRQLADVYLDRHAAVAAPRTIRTLRERMVRPLDTFGDTPLRELEGMADEMAGFAARLPERYRYSVMGAFRQVLAAGVRYGQLGTNPAKAAGRNPQPRPRGIRVFSPAELDALADELDARGAAAIILAAATGLRPAEWAGLRHSDVEKARRVLTVRGTKTARSHREVPLTAAAIGALDTLTVARLSPYLFAGPKGGPLDVHNFRQREWGPAVVASGVARPARLYDLRSTFASNSLAAGLTVYELARVMGTSVQMIERHYGALLDTAAESMLARLEAGSRAQLMPKTSETGGTQ